MELYLQVESMQSVDANITCIISCIHPGEHMLKSTCECIHSYMSRGIALHYINLTNSQTCEENV